MKLIILVLACWCACASSLPPYFDLEDAAQHFEDFINKFNKQYVDEIEKQLRFEIFKSNLEKVNELNKDKEEPLHGMTGFFDLTLDEFHSKYTGLLSVDDPELCPTVLTDADIPDKNIPESFDWRDHGVVTPIKTQGQCGSCWAFGAIGNVEGQYALKNKTLTEFSEQQLVDCDKKDSACVGGIPSQAMRHLMEYGGSITEANYPYTSTEGHVGPCQENKKKPLAVVKSCVSYNLTSQEKVKQLLYSTGPITIAIQADVLFFINNQIIPDKDCFGRLNHAVLLVGYGVTANNESYWSFKNSWGTNSGDHGYVRLQRDESNPKGACGMLNSFMVSAIVA